MQTYTWPPRRRWRPAVSWVPLFCALPSWLAWLSPSLQCSSVDCCKSQYDVSLEYTSNLLHAEVNFGDTRQRSHTRLVILLLQ